MRVLIPANNLAEVIYFLGVLKQIEEGPHEILIQDQSKFAREHISFFEELCRGYCPWVGEITPYFKQFHGVDLDMRGYTAFRGNHSLLAAQAAYCGVDVPAKRPWIVPPRGGLGRVVITRSREKQNSLFPWEQVLQNYSAERLVFLGSAEEHDVFNRTFRSNIDHAESSELPTAMSLLSSAKLVLGNSNGVMALAEAMKLPVLVELSLSDPDCVFDRPNAGYSFTGKTVLPPLRVGQRPKVLDADVPVDIMEDASRVFMPELGWWYPGRSGRRDLMFYNLNSAVMGVKEAHGLTTSDTLVEEAIIRHTVRKFPGQFLPHLSGKLFQKVLLAFREAGSQINVLSDCFTIPVIDPITL